MRLSLNPSVIKFSLIWKILGTLGIEPGPAGCGARTNNALKPHETPIEILFSCRYRITTSKNRWPPFEKWVDSTKLRPQLQNGSATAISIFTVVQLFSYSEVRLLRHRLSKVLNTYIPFIRYDAKIFHRIGSDTRSQIRTSLLRILLLWIFSSDLTLPYLTLVWSYIHNVLTSSKPLESLTWGQIPLEPCTWMPWLRNSHI